MPNVFARDWSRLDMFLLAMIVAFASTGGAHGQEADADSTAPPATNARWAVGGQLSPLYGASVRWAATPRFALQVTGAPGFGANMIGTVGLRGLYKFVKRSQFNVYGGIGGASFVRKDLVLASSGVTEETNVDWMINAVIGAETAIGKHFGLSGEGGVGYARFEELWWFPSFGVGFHYYW